METFLMGAKATKLQKKERENRNEQRQEKNQKT